MLDLNFFQLDPITANAMEGQYDYVLVVLSCAIAILASYVALEIARSIRQDRSDTLSRSIRQLSNITKEIAAGNHNKRAIITTSDEIGQLGSSFNQMVDELVDSTKKKDKFLSMAAHDLRNPLSVILESCSLLSTELENKINDEQKQLLSMIHRASNSMLNLLNELLVVNALNSNIFHIVRNKVGLRKFGEGIFEFNQLIAKKKKINFILDMQIKNEIVSFDAEKIDQVINNFLSNAFKFSKPDSTVKFVIIEDGNTLRIEVHDEAGGILESEQKQVFTPFPKISTRAIDGEPSYGLGLAICKDIIVAHNGEIGFISTPGKGSVFYFELNIRDDFKSAQDDKETMHTLNSI